MNLRDWISLFNLEDDSLSNYREQLYASGRNLILKFNHFVELLRERNGMNVSQISDLFGISEKQFRKWRYGKSPIPLRVLKEISNQNGISDINIENEIDYLSSSRGINLRIPRTITPLLIEIFGRFSGDGSCGIYNGDYKWSLKEEGKRFVQSNQNDMETIFGVGGKYIDYGTYGENLIRSKSLVLLFQQIFEYTDEFKKTYDLKPPHFLEYIEWEKRRYFTTGLIDTEGSFYKSRKSYYFEIHMVNKNLILEAAKAFDEFGIPYKEKHHEYTEFKLISYGKVNCNLILEIFNIKNEKHLRKLAEWGIM